MESERIPAGAQRNPVKPRNLKRDSLGSRHCIHVLEDLWPESHSQILSMVVRRVKRTCGTPTHPLAPIPIPDSYTISCSLSFPHPILYHHNGAGPPSSRALIWVSDGAWLSTTRPSQKAWNRAVAYPLSSAHAQRPWVRLGMMFSDARKALVDLFPCIKRWGGSICIFHQFSKQCVFRYINLFYTKLDAFYKFSWCIVKYILKKIQNGIWNTQNASDSKVFNFIIWINNEKIILINKCYSMTLFNSYTLLWLLSLLSSLGFPHAHHLPFFAKYS